MTDRELPVIEQTPVESVLKTTGADPGPLLALNVCALLIVVILVGAKRVMA
jgi:hypothetical protein